jgi:hypothetical protein
MPSPLHCLQPKVKVAVSAMVVLLQPAEGEVLQFLHRLDCNALLPQHSLNLDREGTGVMVIMSDAGICLTIYAGVINISME